MKFRLPDYLMLYTEDKDYFVPCSGNDDFGDVSVQINNNSLFVTAQKTPLRYIRLRWNFDEHELRLDPIHVLGDFYECTHGILGWRPVMPDRFMPWYFLVSNGSDRNDDTSGRFTECFGVKVRPNAIIHWQYDGNGITFCADIRNGGDGVILNGRKLKICEFIFTEFRDISAFESGKRFCHMMCDKINTPPYKVYGSNNWYYAYGKSSHEEILADAKLIADATKGLENRPFMVIDDGWEYPTWDTPWRGGNEKFPDMPGLAKEISDMNVRPGIWVHLLYDENRTVPNEKEEWHLQRDPKRLDPSHPDVKKYVYDTVQLLCKWGYKLIKQDMSTGDIFNRLSNEMFDTMTANGWHFYDRSRTTAEIVIDFYSTIVEAATPYDCVVIGCGCLPHLAAGLFHLNRIGSDTSGYSFNQTRKFGVNALAFRLMQNGAFYAADADCVGITGVIPWYLNKQWLDIVAHSGSPLFVSCKPGVLNEEEMNDLRKAMEINSAQNNNMIPLDWMENDIPQFWKIDGETVRYDWYGQFGEDSFNG